MAYFNMVARDKNMAYFNMVARDKKKQ